jgi:hypothetical protein
MADRSDMGSSCCAPPPAVLAGVMKELKNMKKSPPDGIKVFVNESNIADVQADIEGPGMSFDNFHPLSSSSSSRTHGLTGPSFNRLSQSNDSWNSL